MKHPRHDEFIAWSYTLSEKVKNGEMGLEEETLEFCKLSKELREWSKTNTVT